MKKYWTKEELEDFWRLLPEEKELLGNKKGIQKFLYLLLLKYYSIGFYFPSSADDIPKDIIEFGIKQYAITLDTNHINDFLSNYDSCIKYQREIRVYYGTEVYSETRHQFLKEYIYKVTLETVNQDKIEAEIILLCKKYKIEKPGSIIVQNLVKEACVRVESYLFDYIINATSTNPECLTYIDDSLLRLNENDKSAETLVSFLKQASSKSNIDGVTAEIEKLNVITPLQIDTAVIPEDMSPSILKFYKRKIVSDTPEQIRSKPSHIRYPLVIIFCYLKRQELLDNLIDHFSNLVHKMKKKADKVESLLNNQIGKLSHGLDALYQVAKVAYDKPEGIIRDAIYPVVPRDQLEKLIKIRNIQKNMKSTIHQTVMRSYSSYYRKQIFQILNAIAFKSNNLDLLEALKVVKKYEHSKCEYYPANEDYEYAIFKCLKDKLRIKEVWILGSFKYKDPSKDIPKDFDENREFYYQLLNQPLLPEAFTSRINDRLENAIKNFDTTIQKNPYVKITERKGKPWIRLTPLSKQLEPQNLEKLKEVINKNWDSISLLDVLKEVDLLEGFTQVFTSAGNREILSKEVIQKRLILCLFAIGTNTGLSRIASSSANNVTLEELKYIKRKFVNQDDLREAITKVVNAIFRIRNTDVWGEATTACASDSRKFTSWDQNLMSEWHSRYNGPGIMIYWHVSKQSICIYSQLKTCSSSEVAAMLQGVISHSTDMLVESQYVDSHGKSELGFALSYLLGFELLPRYAEIGSQKIYLHDHGHKCKHINSITTRPINWQLIEDQYDWLIKYAAALKIGTITAESIIRQFSKSNFQSPIFKAFIELGKAIKSIFLCKYLSSIELRQEIQSGLNIVENWNSLNDFIFYGKKSEISSNSHDEQECSMLCLHLLQVCLAYVNTLLIQKVLESPSYAISLTFEDKRGITPLIYGHINPYGIFELDMSKRIVL